MHFCSGSVGYLNLRDMRSNASTYTYMSRSDCIISGLADNLRNNNSD